MTKTQSKGKKPIIITIIAICLVALIAWYGCVAYIYLHHSYSGNYRENLETRYIAHRGLSSEYYQNTESAFFNATQRPFFSGIECDIWLTLDGVWVCCHDNNPFVNKSIMVTESNYDDIIDLPLDTSDATVDVDISKAKLTPFSKYLSVLQYSDKSAFIELKQDYSQESIDELVALVHKKLPIYSTYYCSFNIDIIEKVQKSDERVNTMMFSGNAITSLFYMRMGYNVGYNKNLLEKKQGRIESHHKENSFVNVYTINDYDEAQKFAEMGVDYITTDIDFSKE